MAETIEPVGEAVARWVGSAEGEVEGSMKRVSAKVSPTESTHIKGAYNRGHFRGAFMSADGKGLVTRGPFD